MRSAPNWIFPYHDLDLYDATVYSGLHKNQLKELRELIWLDQAYNINRTVIEKYSHSATLKEVEENDYNLNIPHYVVDTFEEKEIDIQAVMAEIKSLENKRTELDKEFTLIWSKKRKPLSKCLKH